MNQARYEQTHGCSGSGLLHVITGRLRLCCFLMRFRKAPNQTFPPRILGDSPKTNSFPKTITNWAVRRTIVLSLSMLSIQPSQARRRNIIIHVRDIADEGWGWGALAAKLGVINSNVLSVSRPTNADLAARRGFRVSVISCKANKIR